MFAAIRRAYPDLILIKLPTEYAPLVLRDATNRTPKKNTSSGSPELGWLAGGFGGWGCRPAQFILVNSAQSNFKARLSRSVQFRHAIFCDLALMSINAEKQLGKSDTSPPGSGEQRMLKTGSFFRDEITKCHELAAEAETASDRVFWLGLARRWVDLLRVQRSGGPNFEAVHKLRPP
jgi:hypothetical protein